MGCDFVVPVSSGVTCTTRCMDLTFRYTKVKKPLVNSTGTPFQRKVQVARISYKVHIEAIEN